jgi:hypothetical protein
MGRSEGGSAAHTAAGRSPRRARDGWNAC